jgi:hypothetical protein
MRLRRDKVWQLVALSEGAVWIVSILRVCPLRDSGTEEM